MPTRSRPQLRTNEDFSARPNLARDSAAPERSLTLLNPEFNFFPNGAAIRTCHDSPRCRSEKKVSDPRLLELAQKPLQQRASRIAELFSEGIEDQSPPAPSRAQRRAERKAMLAEKPAAVLARGIRALRYWLAPRQAPRLFKNLGLTALQLFTSEKVIPAAGARAEAADPGPEPRSDRVPANPTRRGGGMVSWRDVD